ncbi:MAG: hypothetical protein IKH82_03800 [Clostridiales bacterium]|nr:hypothetical protein [Clostridiales bacterium]
MTNTTENEEKYFWAICLGDCMHPLRDRWIASYWRLTYEEFWSYARQSVVYDWKAFRTFGAANMVVAYARFDSRKEAEDFCKMKNSEEVRFCPCCGRRIEE